jgi:formylglycine-generating enzyme required for sulfatase activity
MITTLTPTQPIQVSRPAGAAARRLALPLAAIGRWLAVVLVAGATVAAQAERTATATATVMSGFVVDITVTDGGAGYLVPPAVTITGGGGSGATAEATVSNSAVSRVTVLTTGSGYTSTPNVVISPPPTPPTLAIQLAPMLVVDGEPGSTARVSYAEFTTPTTWVVITNVVLGADAFTWCDPAARPGQRRYQAVAVPPDPRTNTRTAAGTVVVFNGFVVSVTVTNGGEGYLSPPSVTFTGSGSGATATATISNGVVTQVTVNNTGSGYISASVVFSAPPRLTKLTEYQVLRVTVRQVPPAGVVLQSSAALGGTNPWTDRITIVTNSNEVVWFDLAATQAMSRFYRVRGYAVPTNLVVIPAGSFVMGSPASEPARWSDETQHTVTLTKGFCMGKFEVTQAEYLAVMGNNPSYCTGDLSRPVERVSWHDATNYCAQLTARERSAGRLPARYVYRLPTESEWEYACRVGTTTAFHYGAALRSGMANFDGHYEYPPCGGSTVYCVNPSGIYLARTTSVGSYAPNAWGLYDMHGNVLEWCQDWYGVYPSGSVSDPQGAPTGSDRVVRGGNWINYAFICRSARRDYDSPTSRYGYGLGFRVVLAPGQ